jgi:hypothetical protein
MSERKPLKVLKKPKKVYAFRLSDTTKKMIELMCEYDHMSEADIVAYAVEKMYRIQYRREMPDKFPDIRNSEYLIP